MNGGVRKFAKGEVIFTEGAMETFMYDLRQGRVGMYSEYGTPGELLLAELNAEKGAILGELGLLDAMPRSATAVALEDVEACVVTEENFADYIRENPKIVKRIMQNISKRIRELNKDYMDACHAVAELVERESDGREESKWFKKNLVRILEDFKTGYERGVEHNVYRF